MSLSLGIAVSILACLVILLGFMFLILYGQLQALESRVDQLEWQRSRDRHPAGRKLREHPEAL